MNSEPDKPYITLELPQNDQILTSDEITRNIQLLSKYAWVLRLHSGDPIQRGADTITAEMMPQYLTTRGKGGKIRFRFINSDVSRTYTWVEEHSRGSDRWSLVAKD